MEAGKNGPLGGTIATAAKSKLYAPLELWSSTYLITCAAARIAFQCTPSSPATATLALALVVARIWLSSSTLAVSDESVRVGRPIFSKNDSFLDRLSRVLKKSRASAVDRPPMYSVNGCVVMRIDCTS